MIKFRGNFRFLTGLIDFKKKFFFVTPRKSQSVRAPVSRTPIRIRLTKDLYQYGSSIGSFDTQAVSGAPGTANLTALVFLECSSVIRVGAGRQLELVI